MRLDEEITLRRIIRSLIRETVPKVNRGWEGYDVSRDADNTEVDSGYDAHYLDQRMNVAPDHDHIAELESGGTNVIKRRGDSDKKS